MATRTNTPPKPHLGFGTRIRKSPFFESTLAWGCKEYTTYNHMYFPVYYNTPEEDYFKMVVTLCRILMPDANIQIPPNLSPNNYHEFLTTGINDWGGISPITSDYVNPEFSWPNIQNVEKKCNDLDFSFKARFPVYPEFIPLVNNDLKQRISLIADEENYVKESYWK